MGTLRAGLARLLVGGFAAGAVLLFVPGVANAQYAPAPTPVIGVGAFTAVVTVGTCGPGGATVTATVDGATITVTCAAGTFTTPTQIVISTGTPPAPPAGFVNEVAFGIAAELDGAPVAGTFAMPLSVTVTDTAITPGWAFDMTSATGDVPVPGATVAAGMAHESLSSDPDDVLLAPVAVPAAVVSPSVTPSAVPSATVPVTGKPFRMEEMIGGGLVGLGLVGFGGLGTARLRRRRTRYAA
jgi:hypothetical protein